jgi:hypothetical protein
MDYKEKLKKALEGIDGSRFTKFTDKQLWDFDKRNITGQHLKAAQCWSKKSEEYRKEVGKRSGQSRLNRQASENHKDKISKGLKGKPKSEEHKKNLSISKIGKKMNNEQKERYKLLFKGERNPMFGKKQSDKSRKKMSDNHYAKKLIQCPYCGYKCAGNNYKRYHGDNCKLNTN